MAASVTVTGSVKTDYGIDAPEMLKSLTIRGGVFAAFGLLIWFMNRATMPRNAAALLVVLAGIGIVHFAIAGVMLWSSRVGKLAMRDRLLDALALKGDEKLLDVGCGRGLLLIGAAKRLTTGRGTGIDIWSEEHLSANSADAVRVNAKAEGVADRIRVEDADARKLPYGNESFDVVMSSLVVHNLDGREEREQAITEMARVLKPGGRIAVFDIVFSGEYAKILQELGLVEVGLSTYSFLWCVPGRLLTARKK
ncbi:MAG TPA: class I SAM-dependent methyltransferase [Bryobacteraceae bacterium]|nr:class I SAM-dependent methyltransferase [Bryobacteraceae bacterium]